MVRDAGLEPVALPCIEIEARPEEDLAAVRSQCEDASLLFVTSARTVDVLWPTGGAPPVPVAAVGQKTAERVTESGGHVTFVGNRGSLTLANAIARENFTGPIVFPRGARSNPEAVDAMRSAGLTVIDLAVYDTRTIAPPNKFVDAVMFGSPTAVTGWLMGRSLDGMVVGAVGETTARCLAEVGLGADLIAGIPSYKRLAEELAKLVKVRAGM